MRSRLHNHQQQLSNLNSSSRDEFVLMCIKGLMMKNQLFTLHNSCRHHRVQQWLPTHREPITAETAHRRVRPLTTCQPLKTEPANRRVRPLTTSQPITESPGCPRLSRYQQFEVASVNAARKQRVKYDENIDEMNIRTPWPKIL